MARYFVLRGKILDSTTGEPLPPEEFSQIVGHMLDALNPYESDGFRFVDIDSSGTLTTGEVEFSWSDYGLASTRPTWNEALAVILPAFQRASDGWFAKQVNVDELAHIAVNMLAENGWLRPLGGHSEMTEGSE